MKRSILAHVEYDATTGRLYVMTLPNDHGRRMSTLVDGTYDSLEDVRTALDAALLSVRNQLLRDIADSR